MLHFGRINVLFHARFIERCSGFRALQIVGINAPCQTPFFFLRKIQTTYLTLSKKISEYNNAFAEMFGFVDNREKPDRIVHNSRDRRVVTSSNLTRH